MHRSELRDKRSFDERALQDSLFSACEKLRGRVDASSFKIYLITIIFIKHISILSNRTSGIKDRNRSSKELEFFIPYDRSFDSLYERRFQQGIGKRIDDSLRSIEISNSPKFDGLFDSIRFGGNHFGSELESDVIFRELLEVFSIDNVSSTAPEISDYLDITSWLYDFTIEYLAELEGKNGGEYATPRAVSTLLSQLLVLKPHETVCDPACGAGSTLVVMARETRQTFGLPPCQIFGQEKNQNAWFLAKLNLFVHGEYSPTILHGDTLRSPQKTEDGDLQNYDVVVAHPPFQMRWEANKVNEFCFPERFSRGIPPESKGDYAFILHMLSTLKRTTGRMGIVVSHGVLFRGGVEGKIREQLIREDLLEAVIGLPPKLFHNTAIPAALLLFRNRKLRHKHKILFIDASRDFTAHKSHNRLEDSHVTKIVSTYETYSEIDDYSRVVDFGEIENNDFNLGISRYITSEREELIDEVDLKEVRFEREKISRELKELESKLRTRLSLLAP